MKHSAKHIADRIRLMIATNQFQVGEQLPSTRELGRQLEASFHTVRKAYQALQEEGLIEGHPGRGFRVTRQKTLLDKAQRLETGAGKVRSLIEELIGYGLDETEIESLFEEQLTYQEWPERIHSSVVVAETREIAQMISDTILREVGLKTDSASVAEVDPSQPEAIPFDALFLPVHLYGRYRHLADQIRLLPLQVTFEMDVLLELTERLASETIGLVTAEDATIPVLINSLKQAVQIEGAFLAEATYGKSLPLFVRTTDRIVYTKGSAKLVESRIPSASRLLLTYSISEKNLQTIRSEFWEQ